MALPGILEEADLPLEVVILLIAGLMISITGIMLFPVSAGLLPYYENGVYGLLLVLSALQMITLGKTPFGELRRSKPLLVLGFLIAAVGIAVCFVPDILGRLPRGLVIVCLGPGGLLLLLRMCFAEEKLRSWMKHAGLFWHLIFGCGVVHVLSMLVALLVWRQDLLARSMMAATVVGFGVAIVYVACVLRKIYGVYPEAGGARRGDVALSTDQAMILLMGTFMAILGILLVPVNLGLLPFSESAQLGLLMVIFAIQMLATGNTPIGPFPRSWLIILSGLVFAVLGTVSCMIPGILVMHLRVLVGVLNILGGIITLWKICVPRPRRTEEPYSALLPVMRKLFAAQLAMNLLTILFGISMLASSLIPGLFIGVILAVNGCLLLYLVHILIVLEKIKGPVLVDPPRLHPAVSRQ